MGGPYWVVGDWVLLPTQHSIVHKQTQQSRYLGAQNFVLLQYLLKHPQQVMAREQLLNDVWQGITVNDNTLSKAIAELRKALGDDSKQARYIVTLPKRGYQLIAAASQLDELPAMAPKDTPVVELTRQRWWLAFSVALPLTLMLVWWLWPTTPAPRNVRVQPFTSDAGVELSPSFSFDGQWLAYVAYPAGSNEAQLRVQALTGDHPLVVVKQRGELELPTWSPRQWYLAYVQRNATQCDVVVARFDRELLQLNDSLVIGRCAPPSRIGLTSLQWSADGQSLFYHRLNEKGDRELVRHDWQQQKITVVKANVPYVFAVHPHRDEMVYASVELMSSSLQQANLSGELINTFYSRAELFLGLSWDVTHNAVLVSSGLAGGRLERVDLDGRVSTVFTSNSPLMQPVVSPINNVIAATQVVVKHDLWLASTDPRAGKSAHPLIASTHFDYSPQFSHSGQHLVFISNRNGKPEVWRALRDGSEQQRLTSLPDDQWPVNVQWSPDDRYIAIGSAAKQIWRYDVVSNTLAKISPSNAASKNPRWSNDGQRLYFAQQSSKEGRIYYYDHATQQTIDTGIDGDLYVPDNTGQYAYILRYGNSEVRGVWRRDLTSQQEQRLLPPLDRFNWQNFSVSRSGFYFLEQENGAWRVKQWREQGVDTVYVMATDAAGPLFIDFAISPNEQEILFTHITDLQTDIILLR